MDEQTTTTTPIPRPPYGSTATEDLLRGIRESGPIAELKAKLNELLEERAQVNKEIASIKKALNGLEAEEDSG